MAKTRYFRLGDEASVFYSPGSGLKITRGQVVEIESVRVRHDEKFKAAKTGGHIVEITEDDFNKAPKDRQRSLLLERKTDAAKAEEEEEAATKKGAAGTKGTDDEDEDDEDEDDTDDEDEDDEDEEEDLTPQEKAARTRARNAANRNK